MNTLVIYDSTGYIISQASGSVREPIGIPFLWVEMPQGKQIKITNGIGIDVSITPNVVILEDIPKSEMQLLQEKISEMETLQEKTNVALNEANIVLKTSGLDSIDALFAVMDKVRVLETGGAV